MHKTLKTSGMFTIYSCRSYRVEKIIFVTKYKLKMLIFWGDKNVNVLNSDYAQQMRSIIQ